MTAVVFAALLTTAATILVIAGIRDRAARRLAAYNQGLAELNARIDNERWCRANGHAYKAQQTPTVWRCRHCGHSVKSMSGWVGDR